MNYTRPRVADAFKRPLEIAYFPPGLKNDPAVSCTAKMVAAQLAGEFKAYGHEAQPIGYGGHIDPATHRMDEPPTQEEIAERLGVSVRTVSYSFAELREREYLTLVRRRQGRPRYLFRAPQMRLEFDQVLQPVAGLKSNQALQQVAGPDMQPVAGPDRQQVAYRSNNVVVVINKERTTTNAGAGAAPFGMTAADAAQLAGLRSPEWVAEWVSYIEFCNAPGSKRRRIENPTAYLLGVAGRDGEPLPPGWFLERRDRDRAQLQLRERTALDAKREAPAAPAAAIAPAAGDGPRPFSPDAIAALPESTFKTKLLARMQA